MVEIPFRGRNSNERTEPLAHDSGEVVPWIGPPGSEEPADLLASVVLLRRRA